MLKVSFEMFIASLQISGQLISNRMRCEKLNKILPWFSELSY